MIESVQSATLVLIRKLIAKGHEVYLINSQDASRENQILEDIPGFHYCPVALKYSKEKTIKKMLQSMLFQILCLINLLNLTRKTNIDVIFYTDTFASFHWKFAKRIIHAKAMIYVGDLMSGYFEVYDFPLFQTVRKIVISLELSFLRAMDRVLVVSVSFKKFLIEHGFSPDKVSIVYDHIDVNKFFPEVSNYEIRRSYNLQDYYIVMTHGLLSQIKGAELLIEAIPSVLKEFSNVKFLIVGDGPSLPYLRLLARSMGVSKAVIFTGWVDYDTIPKFISVADVGVVLRRSCLANQLIVSQTLLQFMAMGKPVVVPKLRGMFEVVKHGGGITFEPGNVQQLANAIIWLLKNKEKSVEMGKKGRKICEEKFNRDVAVESFVMECTHQLKAL
jgi:glycosyltransferase involved in cell wall biosynthesis